jgi:transmembrane sensor
LVNLVRNRCLPFFREAPGKKEKMTQELLSKFLNDQCTDEELKKVIQWVKNDAPNNYGRNLGSEDWKNFQEDIHLLEKEQYNSMLQKIHQKIISGNRIENKPLLRISAWLTKAAAILLLPVLGILFYLLINQWAEFSKSADLMADSLQIVTPIGSRSVVQLSDGSQVYLNHGSKIKYPQKFTGKTREVILSGEGYFIVARDPDKPFYVKTGKLSIKALGTEFNVFAYPGDELTATTLVNGKVAVEQALPGGKIKSVATLIPGQHLVYHPGTGNIELTNGNTEKYIAWKEGKLIFDNEPISSVADKLNRMFNVDIEIADNIKDYTYTVTLVDEPLFQILDLMKIATPVKYKVIPRRKLSDGTFSRQKIFIEKRI